MASDDRKIQTNPAPKNDTLPRTRALRMQLRPRLRAARKTSTYLEAIAEARGRNRCRKPIGKTGT
jgi:hypothetical protein